MFRGKHYGGPVHCEHGGPHEVESTEYCTECLISVCREHSETCRECGAVWCCGCADLENGLCLDCTPYSDGGVLVCEGCGGECREHRWSRRRQKFLGECCWPPVDWGQEVDGFAAENYARLQIGILGAVIGWEEDEETEILPRGPREEAETEPAGNFA